MDSSQSDISLSDILNTDSDDFIPPMESEDSEDAVNYMCGKK